ncbi:glycosyltransferase family 2 protein [Curvibacter sp. APW13]|uniref:glycosyltransferase family 2 protein n=1 Tax=Curvibacter sp. APW13 TaxID=3077236 RepID=UPI0028DF9FEB|nr:glycosyltransferase family 2 protein [Curvibacter sp. APW13]MDT8991556.1 glycosyltransferase family 2 protein [Curvibacter sp. APW13]
MKKLLSIVVPFFNEEEGIEAFHASLSAVMDGLPTVAFEVICVDDGSKDRTLQGLIGLRQRDARFVVVELSRNFGKEAALTAGIDAAKGDAVIPMDADLQDPPSLIAPMIEAWQSGFEVVLAKRVDRRSDSFLKRKTAELFYRVHNGLSTVKIPANVGDFRLMDRSVVDALRSLPEQQRFMKGLFAWVGYRTTTVEYARSERAAGQTKFSGWKLWNLALEGITGFSIAPLKIWTYLGGLGAVLSLLYALFIVIRTVVQGVDLPGYASLMVAIIFFGSVQLIGIGMLGEYIGRIYIESKRRPVYLVRKQYGGRSE